MAAGRKDPAPILSVGLISRARRVVARRRRWLFAAAILLFVYAAAGFLLLPWILHRQLEQRLALPDRFRDGAQPFNGTSSPLSSSAESVQSAARGSRASWRSAGDS